MSDILAVIYDCDGVLFDSRQANVKLYNHILSRFGRPDMTETDVEYVHISTAKEAISYLFKGDPNLDEALAYWPKLDYSPFLDYLIVEPHLEDILEYLRPKFKTAVSTNRGITLKMVLERKGLSHLFDMTVSALDVNHPKPHPEGPQKILSTFGISPNQAIYVGDSEVDQLTSKRAGLPFVAYKNRALNANYHIQNHLELKKILPVKL